VPVIYHIATAADWELAVAEGAYTTSTAGRSLAEEGFIHASSASQVNATANRFYRGRSGLVLLVIEVGRLNAPRKYEDVPGAGEPFPHLYGPLNVAAVTGVVPLAAEPDGSFSIDPPGA
jgi:uncharacterized protein (DUF952 family)